MTITITAVAKQNAASPRVLLNVASSPSVTGSITVTRIHSDGSRHPVLVESRATIVNTWTGFDFHIPFNDFVTYEAKVGAQVGVSGPVVVVSSQQAWLIPPSDVDRAVAVDLISQIGEPEFSDPSIRYEVLGKRLPNHRRDRPRGGESGSMTVVCWTPQSWAKLWALFADGGQLLVNNPRERHTAPWKWIQPGSLVMGIPVRGDSPVREARFSYVETSQPAPNVAAFTYAELAAAFPTYAGVAAAYSNYGAMKIDARS